MQVGTVASLWRYPVKSMRGERLSTAFLGFAGMYGDRIYAFTSTANPPGFPFLTGRTQRAMLQYQPCFRNVTLAERPPTLAAAEQLSPSSNLTTAYSDPDDLQLEVRTHTGEQLAVTDPRLLSMLSTGIDASHVLALIKSQRALTDCRPISLFSLQTVAQLEEEMGIAVDLRRFRANLYLDLNAAHGFTEDTWVGRTVRIGAKVTLKILQRDVRCKMITLDPDTGESNPAIFKQVQQAHESMAGVYAAVLVEGMVHANDAVELLD